MIISTTLQRTEHLMHRPTHFQVNHIFWIDPENRFLPVVARRSTLGDGLVFIFPQATVLTFTRVPLANQIFGCYGNITRCCMSYHNAIDNFRQILQFRFRENQHWICSPSNVATKQAILYYTWSAYNSATNVSRMLSNNHMETGFLHNISIIVQT